MFGKSFVQAVLAVFIGALTCYFAVSAIQHYKEKRERKQFRRSVVEKQQWQRKYRRYLKTRQAIWESVPEIWNSPEIKRLWCEYDVRLVQHFVWGEKKFSVSLYVHRWRRMPPERQRKLLRQIGKALAKRFKDITTLRVKLMPNNVECAGYDCVTD